MQDLKVLFVEDNFVDAMFIKKSVGNLMPNCECVIEDSLSKARQQLLTGTFDIVVTDYQLPDGNCFDLLNDIHDIPFIVITGAGNEHIAVKALRSGASDYLIKDANHAYLEILPISVSNAIRHHRNEKALHETRYERNIAGIFKLSSDGLLLDCNSTFAHILGYQTQQDVLSDHKTKNLIPQAQFHQVLVDLDEAGFVSQYEWQLERADGTIVDVLSSISRIEDSEYNFYLEGSVIDISQLNKAQKAHEESLIFIERLAEAIPSILYVYDLIQQRNIYSNREIVKMLGYTTEEIKQMGADLMTNILHPDDLHHVAEHLQKMKLTTDGDVVEIDYRMRSVDNEWHWLRSRDTPLNRADDGTVKQIVGVAQDITEQVKAVEEREIYLSKLQLSHKQLQQLTRQVVLIQEEERHRLSHELHDEANQALAILKLELQQINSGTVNDRQELLDHSIKLVDQTMKHIRNIAYNLRPPALDAMAFTDVLQNYCIEVEQRTGLDIQLSLTSSNNLNDAIKITLYRILQEALTNIVKHAEASNVRVQLDCKISNISLSIDDDGRGFDVHKISNLDQQNRTLGLIGIRERAESLGGQFQITSQPNEGTHLLVTIPMEGEL
jgi:PAS domain S-box-containing protein